MASGDWPQLIEVDPPNLVTFTGPFTDAVYSTVKLKNPSEQDVAFKIKTTAPKQYCVRPNAGIIAPWQTRNIIIMLQPLDEKNMVAMQNHKFQIQTCYVPNGERDIEKIWREINKSVVRFIKLNVNFEKPTLEAHMLAADMTTDSLFQSPIGSPNLSEELEGQLSKEKELKKKIEYEKSVLSKEMLELFKKNTSLQAEVTRYSEGTFISIIHAFFIVFVALFVGLLIGKFS